MTKLYLYFYNNKKDSKISSKKNDKIPFIITYVDPLIKNTIDDLLSKYPHLNFPEYSYEHCIDIDNLKTDKFTYRFKKNFDEIYSAGTCLKSLKEDIEEFKNKTFAMAIKGIEEDPNRYNYLLHYFPQVRIYSQKDYIDSFSVTPFGSK